MWKNDVRAQFYESGTEPPSVRRRQIHTEHFRVIFPVGAEKDGQHAANVLEYIYEADGKSLDRKPKKIPVVLHNRSVISNGFVTWAPKRSEWFLTPPQNNYAHNWLEQLAVHEYRHVVQIDKLNQGFTKALGFAIGQQGVGAVAGLLPKWFLEGDAVASETALSNAGRGRNPAFEMPLRTISLSGKYQSYDKALFGSYRDHVPNHYELGYQMVAWTRERYEHNPFGTTIDFVAHEPFLFFLYPFRLGLKKETGYGTPKLYQTAFDDLTLRWKEQEKQTGYDTVAPLNHRKTKIYTNYRSPQYLNDSDFMALRTSMEHIARFVKVDEKGNEQVIFTPGIINSERVSYGGGLLAWTEEVQDIRWTNQSYSVIKLFDMRTGKERLLHGKTRLFAPSISPDGSTIAAVEISVTGESALVFFDVVSGKEKERTAAPDNTLLQTPSWSKDGKYLLLIVNDKNGKSVAKYDIVSGLFTTVLPPTYDDISYPVDAGQHVLFTGYYNGITNIYAADYGTGKVVQVTSSRFGAFDPQPDDSGDRMLYAEYSPNGYNLVETKLDIVDGPPVDRLSDGSLKLYETLAKQENFNMQDSIIPNTAYRIKPYRKWANLFNVHSWAPLYYKVDPNDVMSTEFYPGLVLLSQDLSGNMVSSVGYSWRGYNAFHADISYRGLYPIVDVTVDYGGQKPVIGPPNDGHLKFNPQGRNTEIGARTYVPFVLTRNRYITGVVPQVKFTYNTDYLYSATEDNYQHGLWKVGYGLGIYRYLKASARDFAPRFGGVLQAVFQHTPANTEQLGYIYYVTGRMYLPGFAKHHSLQLAATWQQQKTNYYLFGTLVNFPRGYVNGRTEELGIGTVEYAFPIAYPDWNWSLFVYLKRLRTNLFCDVAENRYRMVDNTYNLIWKSDRMLGVGIDLLADLNLLRIYFPINMGIRMAYVPELNEVHPSLLFNVTLN